ncbi:TetR family transcriptional regulator [Clostridia bacterium]|nr:TetR family transcriptional regulator [Clostridia bacterium]GHV31653.1 TetR family transcriptional regulator [Clostridia bacterium]
MPRKNDPAGTVEKILDISGALFMEKGYEQTTMQDIVDKLGMSKGAIFHHFKSKEDVMNGVIQRMVDELAVRAATIAENTGLDAHEKMRRIISAINISGSPSEAMLTELHQPANAQMHQASTVEIVRKIAPILGEVVKQGVRDGVYHTLFPFETIEFILASSQFYLDVATFHWTPKEFSARADAFVRIIELALGATEGSFSFLLDSI